MVEIDPFDPDSMPIKRTSLGRVKHESAYVKVTEDDRIVVYTGDDQVNEHVYKYVSNEGWNAARAKGRSPLDDGVLYVARFNDDGTGDWLPLVHGNTGLTARTDSPTRAKYSSRPGSQPAWSGQPGWTGRNGWPCDPRTGAVYVTLTNNTSPAKVLSKANPRKPNTWGHIVRWQETDGNHTSTTFEWDLFLQTGLVREAGTDHDRREQGSDRPNRDLVRPDGRVWIQTDGTQPLGEHSAGRLIEATRPHALWQRVLADHEGPLRNGAVHFDRPGRYLCGGEQHCRRATDEQLARERRRCPAGPRARHPGR